MKNLLNDAAVETAVLLLSAPDAAARSAIIASAIVDLIPESACSVYRVIAGEEGDAVWTAIAAVGDISIQQANLQSGTRLFLPLLEETPSALVYPVAELRREDYAHLSVARSFASLAYVPLLRGDNLVGAIEILTFSGVLESRQLKEIAPLVQLASPAILAAESNEEERQTLLDSVHRMSQLYDLEKSLNSTLEFDAVIQMVPEKAIAMMPSQALHLWLFEGGVLRLVSSQGADATVELGMQQKPGEGYVADMAEEGEPLLMDDPEDERLSLRNAAAAEDSGIPPVTNALLVPLIQDVAEVGVLEAINRDDHPFDDDDLFFLTSMAETVSSALKNASLMLAERKLEILEALVRVSSEITSTLRLDRLLQIIVNSPQNVLPYELCAIALDNRGRLQLKAVSGMASLPLGDAQVERLQELMQWLSSQPDSLYLNMHEETAEEERQELPAAVVRYFDETGCRGLYSLPLNDDQGRVGLLLYVSSVPDFLELPHTELLNFASGGTVSFAFRAEQLDGMPVLLSHGQWQLDGWFFQILGRRLILRTTDGDLGGPEIHPGRWYSVRWDNDGSKSTLAVDGRPTAPARALRIAPCQRALRVGQYDRPASSYAFQGTIRDVAIGGWAQKSDLVVRFDFAGQSHWHGRDGKTNVVCVRSEGRPTARVEIGGHGDSRFNSLWLWREPVDLTLTPLLSFRIRTSTSEPLALLLQHENDREAWWALDLVGHERAYRPLVDLDPQRLNDGRWHDVRVDLGQLFAGRLHAGEKPRIKNLILGSWQNPKAPIVVEFQDFTIGPKPQ